MIAALDDAARPDERALTELLGIDYEPLALALGAAALIALLAPPRGRPGTLGVPSLARARPRESLLAGLALGLVAAATWIAADAAGYGYGLGFVGAADGTRAALATGRALPFQLWLALGVVAGGALSGRPRLRLPDAARSARAAAGGVLMGVGGNLAHGCNIGHGLTGLPLLSFGSLLATGCMAAGALLTWRLALAPRPRLRGTERAPAGY